MTRALGNLEAVHDEQPVDGAIGEGQAVVVDEDAVRSAVARPTCDALTIGHQGAETLRLAAEGAEIRRCVAEADQRRLLQAAPAGADAMRQQAAHRLTQRRCVEFQQIVNVQQHQVAGPIASRPI